MKNRVLGVKYFPQKEANYIVLVNQNEYNGDKVVCVGVNPREVWVNQNVIPRDTAIGFIGKDVEFTIDFNGRVVGFNI